VESTIRVGTGPYAVATNPLTRTIYVTNYVDNTVSVISGRTNTIMATVPVGTGPVRMDTVPAADTVYVSNSADNTVTVLNG
jgi:YVTN family beta-propeller protein